MTGTIQPVPLTIPEFKAWLEGYAEAIDGAPTPEQWAKVLDKVARLGVQPVIPPAIPRPDPFMGQGQNPYRQLPHMQAS